MKTAVVVGSGIAGILSAILLKRKFQEVYLIEKESQVGGLLNSFRNNEGIEFDYGTHFLRDTGNSDLDRLLFSQLLPENWLVLNYLKAGNFFGGQLNDRSPFVDSSNLPEEIYHKGMVQLLSLGPAKETYENLEEQLRDTFGSVFTKHIFKPVLQKFLGHDLHEIIQNTHNLFIPSRLIGFTPEATRELKKSATIDKKLGFHSYTEGLSNSKNYYPKKGGIGLWIEELTRTLQQLDIKIITGAFVKKILYNTHCIQSVILNDNTELNCHQLTWTAPVFLFNQACGLVPPIQTGIPARLISSLHHFVLDQPFLTDLYYCCCYDPDFITFRITMYPNVQNRETSLRSNYPLTVEVLSRQVPDLAIDSQIVFGELQKMNVISSSSKILFRHSEIARDGFPIPTHQFVQDSKSQLEFAQSQFNNILFLGKNTGSTWFMHEVLVETYSTIMESLS